MNLIVLKIFVNLAGIYMISPKKKIPAYGNILDGFHL